MLAHLRKRYQYEGVATDEFRRLCVEHLPPRSPDPELEASEQFVFSTGVPSVKLNYTVKGAAPAWRVSGAVVQYEVDDHFSGFVPVEIHFAKGRPVVHWVRSASQPAPFTVTVKQPPVRVVLDPNGSLPKK